MKNYEHPGGHLKYPGRAAERSLFSYCSLLIHVGLQNGLQTGIPHGNDEEGSAGGKNTADRVRPPADDGHAKQHGGQGGGARKTGELLFFLNNFHCRLCNVRPDAVLRKKYLYPQSDGELRFVVCRKWLGAALLREFNSTIENARHSPRLIYLTNSPCLSYVAICFPDALLCFYGALQINISLLRDKVLRDARTANKRAVSVHSIMSL